jgi:hypothetical protein
MLFVEQCLFNDNDTGSSKRLTLFGIYLASLSFGWFGLKMISFWIGIVGQLYYFEFIAWNLLSEYAKIILKYVLCCYNLNLISVNF